MERWSLYWNRSLTLSQLLNYQQCECQYGNWLQGCMSYWHVAFSCGPVFLLCGSDQECPCCFTFANCCFCCKCLLAVPGQICTRPSIKTGIEQLTLTPLEHDISANPCYTAFILQNMEMHLNIKIISQQLDGAGCWNPSLWKTRTHLSYSQYYGCWWPGHTRNQAISI